MSDLRSQTDAQIEKTRSGNPTFMAAVDALIEEARAFETGGNALSLGQGTPDFALPDANGKSVSLAALLQKGPVVVTFYRGGWCPYCNLELRALQSKLEEIHQLGAQLVAISPQKPDESLTQLEKQDLAFPVLSDQDAKVAQAFGVAWTVPDVLTEHMRKDRQLDLTAINNGNGNVLPIPATFVLNAKGEVVWRFVDVDYRKRAEPDDVIAALKGL
ncbi:peroxiredoxin-like family protein [Alteromonas sp. C1M14]|uniref:peroxiredoxin-like family protein n=1 Tax=Alteromonas sp. C1M14 TaxID=2841567 RepID=UPI001C094E0C|nr:peroxiredoxin-like family protein [Alteromonas sp. C1M14]MBU2980097.1 AhpC/TSA family protein [Alteromonas sp. C1M14]